MLLRRLGFQSLEPLRKGLQIVSQPDTTNSDRRYHHAALGKFSGYPNLTQSRLFHRQLHDRLLDVLFNPVLDTGLTPADFLLTLESSKKYESSAKDIQQLSFPASLSDVSVPSSWLTATGPEM
jgi:hypothetical protein